nr:EOG090X0ALT [Sida crystallina]
MMETGNAGPCTRLSARQKYGGLSLGSLCLIEEDEYGLYAKMITKYFMAEGLLHGNYVFCASANENPWEMLNSLPTPNEGLAQDSTKPTENKEELKIAWRYENLSVDGNVGKLGGTSFDLSTPMELTKEQKLRIIAWEGLNITSSKELRGSIQNLWCISLIETVAAAIKQWNLTSGSNSNFLRLVISSCGSSHWQFEENQTCDLPLTMILLKSLLRSANAVAVVTVPHHLQRPVALARCRSISDVVLRLKSLREDSHLQDLMDVHGILEIKKVVNLHSLKSILGHSGTTTYGFKATKRKFKIEKLHLPPSLESDQQSSALEPQEQSIGCSSGASKSKLDF